MQLRESFLLYTILTIDDIWDGSSSAGPPPAPPTSGGSSSIFSGGGHRLGGEDVESEYIPDPNAEPQGTWSLRSSYIYAIFLSKHTLCT